MCEGPTLFQAQGQEAVPVGVLGPGPRAPRSSHPGPRQEPSETAPSASPGLLSLRQTLHGQAGTASQVVLQTWEQEAGNAPAPLASNSAPKRWPTEKHP